MLMLVYISTWYWQHWQIVASAWKLMKQYLVDQDTECKEVLKLNLLSRSIINSFLWWEFNMDNFNWVKSFNLNWELILVNVNVHFINLIALMSKPNSWLKILSFFLYHYNHNYNVMNSYHLQARNLLFKTANNLVNITTDDYSNFPTFSPFIVVLDICEFKEYILYSGWRGLCISLIYNINLHRNEKYIISKISVRLIIIYCVWIVCVWMISFFKHYCEIS